jgi:hypothetical protein
VSAAIVLSVDWAVISSLRRSGLHVSFDERRSPVSTWRVRKVSGVVLAGAKLRRHIVSGGDGSNLPDTAVRLCQEKDSHATRPVLFALWAAVDFE